MTLIRPPLTRITLCATALATSALVAYCGLCTWLPAILAAPVAEGDAAQGLVYIFRRELSALAPFLVGAIADTQGIGAGLALISSFFLIGALLIFTLPETKNMELQ